MSETWFYSMLIRLVSFCDPKHECQRCERTGSNTHLGAGAAGETWGTSRTKRTLSRADTYVIQVLYRLRFTLRSKNKRHY